MSSLRCNEDVAVVRRGIWSVYHTREISPEDALKVLGEAGEPLKQSRKASVKRVGKLVVKQSQGSLAAGLLRHTFRRGRYRRAWLAAHHLRAHGVDVPEPLAYLEKGFLGVVSGNALVSRYLDEFRNVERFMLALVQRGAGRDTLSIFLQDLADAVNQLTASGACHADLSGKNILTRDGSQFYFIDLDAVSLGIEYTDALRMKNHVQLYDSFCDLLNDAMLVPFIERMLTDRHDPRIWMPRVRQGQHERRTRIEKILARQGKRPT